MRRYSNVPNFADLFHVSSKRPFTTQYFSHVPSALMARLLDLLAYRLVISRERRRSPSISGDWQEALPPLDHPQRGSLEITRISVQTQEEFPPFYENPRPRFAGAVFRRPKYAGCGPPAPSQDRVFAFSCGFPVALAGVAAILMAAKADRAKYCHNRPPSYIVSCHIGSALARE